MIPYLLQHLLSETAAKLPGKLAVVHRDDRCTYAQLERLSNQLAHTLLAHGVTSNDRVGIYLDKSVASVVSILAILKAGAIYVPIDPLAPVRRISYIIRNCQIRCLVSASNKADTIARLEPAATPETVVFTDAAPSRLETHGSRTTAVDWATVGRGDASLPPQTRLQTDLAYLLYTSGSTGNPKGVMLSHLNALTFVNWAHDAFGITAEDRVANHAPLHFDLSIFDIFTALRAGATIVLVPDGLSLFPSHLAGFIHTSAITVWYSVPSVLSLLALRGNLDHYAWTHLRLILFAGEVFPVKHLRRLKDLVPQASYYNLYGPTETNVCTFYHVPHLEPARVEPIPIGKACANTEVFALTPDNRLVTAPGEVGELCVRGPAVMQGYWGDPDKSRAALPPNPLQPHFTETMYRTGDLVTLDAAGDYLFLGRTDDMIKSRGYRIALGEIESVLYSHPDIREAAVIPVPDELIGNRIKAFIVPHEGSAQVKLAIEKYCSERLPRYMIPDSIDFCYTLPKTPTGKIDRQLLLDQTLRGRTEKLAGDPE